MIASNGYSSMPIVVVFIHDVLNVMDFYVYLLEFGGTLCNPMIFLEEGIFLARRELFSMRVLVPYR